MTLSTCGCGGRLGANQIAISKKLFFQQPTISHTAVALGARIGVAVALAPSVHLAVTISRKAH